MPYEIPDPAYCRTCPFGYCVINIREASRRMKDRNTHYRMVQRTAAACTFEDWVPGLRERDCITPLSDHIERMVQNALRAGRALERTDPNHFAKSGEIEKPFFLTPAQIGKVRGDTFELLCRAILWNCAAVVTRRSFGLAPTEHTWLEEQLADSPRIPTGVITLGDNYPLAKLFEPAARETLTGFETRLNEANVTLSYSTPDTICISLANLPEDVVRVFVEPINALDIASQERLRDTVRRVEGKIAPADVLFAGGIKTSLRSDRMYQFLFEANAWKYIWRVVFGIESVGFYSLVAGVYGANPGKLRGVDFSLDHRVGAPRSAIDALVSAQTPADLVRWFPSALLARPARKP